VRACIKKHISTYKTMMDEKKKEINKAMLKNYMDLKKKK
jgi:hypothetical protein